jgi:hypothetical protein
VDDDRKRTVERATAKEVFESQPAPPNSLREFPLSFVVGPIGSGKTYFALRHMKDFGNNDETNVVPPAPLLVELPGRTTVVSMFGKAFCRGNVLSVILYFLPFCPGQNSDSAFLLGQNSDCA